MKISLVLLSISMFLNEGIATDSMLIRRRSVDQDKTSRIDVISHLRRGLGSYNDNSEGSVSLQRIMDSSETDNIHSPDDQLVEDEEKVYYFVYYNYNKSNGPVTPITDVQNEIMLPTAEAASPASSDATSSTMRAYNLTLDNIGLIVGMVGLVLGSIASAFIVFRRRKAAKRQIMPVRNLVAL